MDIEQDIDELADLYLQYMTVDAEEMSKAIEQAVDDIQALRDYFEITLATPEIFHENLSNEPAAERRFKLMIAGPVLLLILAIFLYHSYKRKYRPMPSQKTK